MEEDKIGEARMEEMKNWYKNSGRNTWREETTCKDNIKMDL
jgi:hypothetical protein